MILLTETEKEIMDEVEELTNTDYYITEINYQDEKQYIINGKDLYIAIEDLLYKYHVLEEEFEDYKAEQEEEFIDYE
jgi:hypothetical protein